MMIGRKEEQKRLRAAYDSEYSEFVAVFGRRRVGKTFLVRETFNYKFTFTHTGIYKKNTRSQLQEFHASLKRQGAAKTPVPATWSEAFNQLAQFIHTTKDKRKVIFIDEMPWMDAPRSGFVSALEHFWNGWASARKDILLIICGSASSWIINKVLKNHGGLHNRVSTRIHLKPFTLYECELYSNSRKLNLSRMQIAEGYMVMGGIPYYWSRMDKAKSLAQNIDFLFFNEEGEFRHEFDELYASLFNKPEKYLKVIEVLGANKSGMTRREVSIQSGLENNGEFTRMLEDLEYCGFIRKYCHIGKKVKDALYQLIDNYTLFYYQFIAHFRNSDDNYWIKMQGRAKYNNWCGLAFEKICLIHARQIKEALGISGILANVYSWHCLPSKEKIGAQIDMLIDRADGVITICEMKYSKTPYAITAKYQENLLNKTHRFNEVTATTKAVQIIMVTANGLKHNQYSNVIQNELVIDDLFRQ